MLAVNGGRHAVLVQLDKQSSGVLTTCLETLGIRCHVGVRGDERGDIALAFLDGRAPPQLIRTWIARATSVVLVHEADDDAVFDVEADWLSKPLRPSQVRQVVTAALERARLRRAVDELRQQLAHNLPPARVIARSKAMRRAVEQLARTPVKIERPLLICGEAGSGRGLLARTAADEAGHGIIELLPSNVATDGGLDALRDALAANARTTLLLRDADQFPRETQRLVAAALARPRRPILVTVESVAPLRNGHTTARTIHVPPLRERVDDLLPLARHFLDHYAPGSRLLPDAEAVLDGYAWPRNVAELRNTIERIALGGTTEIGASDLPAHLFGPRRLGAYVGGDFSFAEVEHTHLIAVLNRLGTLHAAAQVLGIDDSTLWRIRKRYRMP